MKYLMYLLRYVGSVSYMAFSCAFQNTLLEAKRRQAMIQNMCFWIGLLKSKISNFISLCNKEHLHSSNTVTKFTKVWTSVFVVAHEHSIGNYIAATVPSPTTSHFTIMGYSHGSDWELQGGGMEENYSLINLMLFQYREEQCKTLCNSPLSSWFIINTILHGLWGFISRKYILWQN